MPKRVALVIYRDDYQHTKLARLKTPDVDIDALTSALRDPTIGNFYSVETLINQPAQQVRQGIAGLFHYKQPYDLLLLYFIGHGLVEQAGRLYLAAVDTVPDALAETAIPAAYLASWMNRSFSRQQILILDCVYIQITENQPIPTSAISNAGASINAIFRGRGFGRIVLTGTDTIPYVFAEDGVRGEAEDVHFTSYLVQGLQTGAADVNGDGQVGIRELAEYLGDQFALRGHTQRPHHWTYREPDDFIIAHNPSQAAPSRLIKWDLIFGAIAAPIVILVFGWEADFRASIGLAGLFLMLYAFLYSVLD
jgi:uncharacterized caspase-like protein